MKTQSVSEHQSFPPVSAATSPKNSWRPHRIFEDVAVYGFVIMAIVLYISEVAK